MESLKPVEINEKIDKTITRSGEREYELGVCKWDLYALPEYMDEGDQKLSYKVMDKIALLLNERGLIDSTIKIVEGYDDEKEGGEHFRLVMTFGDGSNNEDKKLLFSKRYSSETESNEVKGIVKSSVGLLNENMGNPRGIEKEVADIYIDEMEIIYPDWENRWEDGITISVND